LKCQNAVPYSSAKAEYLAMTNGVVKACWLQQLLQELHAPLVKSTLIYYNNVRAIYLSTNPIQHQLMKHVEIGLHFVWECVAIGDVHVLHVLATSQFTDIFTKVCLLQCFQSFSLVSAFTVARVLTLGGVRNMMYYKYIGPEQPLV
jgi:hypothetical protein